MPSYLGKQAAALAPTELQEYDALAYEIEMLHDIALWTMQATPPLTQITENVLAESFALHFRNLASFLWPTPNQEKRWPTDLLARHFVSDPSWSPVSKPSDIQSLVDRANREVGHLTTERTSGKTEDKKWQIAYCIRLLLPALVDFAQRADAARRPPRVSEEIDKLRRLVGDLSGGTPVLSASINLTTTTTRQLRTI